MAALIKSRQAGRIVWLGVVPDRDASLRAERLDQVRAELDGFEGEAHGGATRPSCSRFTMLHPKGTRVRNSRQLSILSAAELEVVAARLGLDRLDPELLGAQVVIEGIADLSHLPPGSRLQSGAGTTLCIDLQNGPCHLVAHEIEIDAPGHGKAFSAEARGLRGVTAWVERAGPLAVGDEMALFVPTQRTWAPEEETEAARAPVAAR